MVDADLWLFSGAPAELVSSPRLIVTDGYSIENDVLRDCRVECLLYDDEQLAYEKDIQNISRWFAAGVVARMAGSEFDFDRSLRSLIEPSTGELSLAATADITAWNPPEELTQRIICDYQKLLRGKTWFAVVKKYLCAQGRLVQHQPFALLEIGMRGGGQWSTRLIEAVRLSLQHKDG